MILNLSIEKEHIRRIKLIHFINQQNRWFTIKEISNHLQITDKTVRKDIELLKEEVTQSWNLTIQKGKGIYLKKPLNESLSLVESKILRKSLKLKICEELIFKKNTIQSLAQKLHLQPAALYTTINQIKKKIQNSHLNSKKKPLEITGREQDVRVFMLKLYCNIPKEYWPFPYINKQNITDLIKKIEKNLKVKMYKNAKHKLCMLFAITISRLLTGNTIENINELIKINKNDEHYKTITAITSMNYKTHFGVTLHENESSFLALALLLSLQNSNTTETNKNALTTYKKTFMPLVKKLPKELNIRLQLKINYDEKFLIHLVPIIKKTLNKNFIKNYNYNIKLIRHIKKKHPNTFKTIKEYMNNLKYTVKSKFDDYEIALLTMHFETKRMLSKNTKIKRVYLYNSYSFIHQKYITALLKKPYKGLIKIVKKNTINLTNEALQKKNVDIIISNVNLQIKNIPIVQISEMPTEKELHKIKKII
ncbi:toxin [Bacillus anthracis]|nr:toxin [Bacillus anthracis]